jgi:hypothetical protein
MHQHVGAIVSAYASFYVVWEPSILTKCTLYWLIIMHLFQYDLLLEVYHEVSLLLPTHAWQAHSPCSLGIEELVLKQFTSSHPLSRHHLWTETMQNPDIIQKVYTAWSKHYLYVNMNGHLWPVHVYIDKGIYHSLQKGMVELYNRHKALCTFYVQSRST